ncbi:hypothetical protein QBC35DRAFT_446530 [Podospora australis]|uniref:Uncharacterized protein n=1 Tax=Podospora australis TaxID=1536484 RepID=A0AAN7ANA1_9PEZI|nr:hypothetical protein QBC35DRAFT_446530 [Podospora australis]
METESRASSQRRKGKGKGNERNTFECFFDLPIELQDQILNHICYFHEGIMVDDYEFPHTPGYLRYSSPLLGSSGSYAAGDTLQQLPLAECPQYRLGLPPVDLMLACSELYHRAKEIYYSRNTFYLDFRTLKHKRASQVVGYDAKGRVVRKGGHSRVDAFLIGDAKGAPRLAVKSLVVYFRKFGGHQVEKELIPAMKEMVLRGSLRRVRIDVMGDYTRSAAGSSIRDWNAARLTRANLSGNRALREVLVLLTDPYMQQGKMRVRRTNHGWFWCKFHDQESREVDSDEEGRSGCALLNEPPRNSTNSATGDGDWVEVDIDRLVQAYGGDSAEYKIKSFGT